MFLNLGASEVSLGFEGSETPEGFADSDKLEDGGGLTFESITGPEVPGLSGLECPVGTGIPGGPDEPDGPFGPEDPVGTGAPGGPDNPDVPCGPDGPGGPVDIGTGGGLVVEEGSLVGAFFPIAVMTVEAIFEPPNTFPKGFDGINFVASEGSIGFEGS